MTGTPPPTPPAGPFLCTCFRITAAGMRRIVRENGLRTVEEVAERTGACRGCATCRPDIEAILREESAP